MRIGLIKETKSPVDNRVVLTPEQVAALNHRYTQHQIVVQHSDIRAFTDEEYREAGILVVDDLSDCDLLMGVKEVEINTLIPNKRYFFFGHIAKMQPYNKPLLRRMIAQHITFSDYEYLVDGNGKRVCAFGWWAGVVGVYYTLQGYGLREGLYTLPKPSLSSSLDSLIEQLKKISLPPVKVLVTGNGRVSHGAQFILDKIGAVRLTDSEFLKTETVPSLSYCVATHEHLVKHMDGDIPFSSSYFKDHPEEYCSDFEKWSMSTDILITAHFWEKRAPVYLDEAGLKRTRIRMIGDVTCDIRGSIMSTLRSSTHSDPYYDYNPFTGKEETAFSSKDNITVMAVDTCPNALARDTSKYFGGLLTEFVMAPLLENKPSKIIEGATILKEGHLTTRFAYLDDFARE